MSRHRNVRNLTAEDIYDDEYDESYDNEGQEVPELNDEQEEEMQVAVAQVRSVLGEDAPVTEKSIRSALWYYYFDVDDSVAWLLGELEKSKPKQKKAAAKPAAQRKEQPQTKPATAKVHAKPSGSGQDAGEYLQSEERRL
ncbi:HBS1 N-terminus-domain-containing protein [Thamnocephalis sphaerospora]|uniref:HBS1 N-terminus-domain-containing protein n=1 Tax=Thamnocephalis sphaerospora TaxID=78915 RepID=A0A4P9XHV0_9FUNG|nr:HBS1 N-terminus-domain-containing protein [Thamnocephalis sphaerospora]|eukprot:RKP04881.1 HBS1 N-terminus-domain-containing protein [Thamnocephalis sphaerospora]